MAMQLGALRDVLMHPGDEAKAKKAAEEVAGFENQFTSVKVDLAAIRGEMLVIKLIVGSTVWLTLLVLGAVLTLWSKIGDLGRQLAAFKH